MEDTEDIHYERERSRSRERDEDFNGDDNNSHTAGAAGGDADVSSPQGETAPSYGNEDSRRERNNNDGSDRRYASNGDPEVNNLYITNLSFQVPICNRFIFPANLCKYNTPKLKKNAQ